MDKSIYAFVRRDIPLADQMVQVGHICIEGHTKFKYPSNSNLVLFQIQDERELLELSCTLDEENIKHTMFYEPDDTMAYTTLITEALESKHKYSFKKYQLWEL